jgi:hypothetical protein
MNGTPHKVNFDESKKKLTNSSPSNIVSPTDTQPLKRGHFTEQSLPSSGESKDLFRKDSLLKPAYPGYP